MAERSASVHSVYAVVTQERLLRDDAVMSILEKIGDDIDSLGATRIDGAAADLADVLDELRTQSLLGGRRVVVVEDADGFISAHRSSLEKFCSAPTDFSSLILLCNTLPTNTRLSKIITKTGTVLRPDVPKGRRLHAWVRDRGQTVHGKRLDGAAAQMLADHIGASLAALDAELSKLASYVGRREEITTSDVDTLTGRLRQEKVFAVTDAIDAGDTATALDHWHQVLATDRAAPARALGGLAWAVRRLLETRRQWEEGADIRSLARTMFTDPHVLVHRFQNVSNKELEQRQRDLLTVDLDVKTGLTTVEVAIEKFILKHTVMAGSTA